MAIQKRSTSIYKIDLKNIDLEHLAKRLYVLMSVHIGKKNAISKRNLFKAFFGMPEKHNIYKQHYLWTRLVASVHVVRKNSNCFIVSEERETGWYYFVARTAADAKIHITQGNNRIKGIRAMQSRVTKAVEDKWWKQVVTNARSVKREITDKSTN